MTAGNTERTEDTAAAEILQVTNDKAVPVTYYLPVISIQQFHHSSVISLLAKILRTIALLRRFGMRHLVGKFRGDGHAPPPR